MDMKTYIHKILLLRLFMEALFIIPPNWKQPKYPSVGECINTVVYS